jgi:pentatricopeptide repeat protein
VFTYSPFANSWTDENTRLNEDLDLIRVMKLERACIGMGRELEKEGFITFHGIQPSSQLIDAIEAEFPGTLWEYLEESRKNLEIWGQDTLAGCYFLLGKFEEAAEILKEMISADQHVGARGIEMAKIDLEEVRSVALERGIEID